VQRPASELLDSDRLVAFCGARCLHELMNSALGQQERAVSELMPEVSVLDSFPVRRGDQVRTGDGLEE